MAIENRDARSMLETLTETFARLAEDDEFRRWTGGRTLECRAVYVFQDSGVWKFAPGEWWRFVTRAIRNDGAYELPFSKQLQGYRKKVAVENRKEQDVW